MSSPIQGVTPPDAGGLDPASSARTDKTAATATQAAAPDVAAIATDTANVAQTQSLLQMIDTVAGAIPTVNNDRVDALRQAIANGSYQIDPQNVAKQLTDIERFLRGNGPLTTS